MVFHDLVREDAYDLWIGDEAWELDYYLHENPREKKTPFVWFTDFVGWLPMPDGGDAEAALTADYNAEMVRHIQRHPEVRDRALFVGNADDIVAVADSGRSCRSFATGRRSTSSFPATSPGSIRGSSATGPRFATSWVPRRRAGVRCGRRRLRGGAGHMLRRTIAAYPPAQTRVPGLRMIVVAGPRIDPASLPTIAGVEIYPYVHNLYRHLAATWPLSKVD